MLEVIRNVVYDIIDSGEQASSRMAARFLRYKSMSEVKVVRPSHFGPFRNLGSQERGQCGDILANVRNPGVSD